MPSVSFVERDRAPADFFTRAIDSLTTATITGWGPQVVFTASGTAAYEMLGNGFTYEVIGGTRLLTGGTLATIDVWHDLMPAMIITGLALDAAVLRAAIDRDLSGRDDAAVEKLFLSLGWLYAGGDGRDVLRSSDRSSDGALLDLTGNDTVSTGDGSDDFFLGRGNDIGFGGSGSDRLDGGNGRDSLSGEQGTDTLLGGQGSDDLSGGTGQDSLDGGTESDWLSGGRDADTLTGGDGADTFAFVRRDGVDLVTDFNPMQDRIDLEDGVRWTFAVQDGDTVLRYGTGGNMVVLAGVSITETDVILVI